MRMRKTGAWLLAITLLISLLSVPAQAAAAYPGAAQASYTIYFEFRNGRDTTFASSAQAETDWYDYALDDGVSFFYPEWISMGRSTQGSTHTYRIYDEDADALRQSVKRAGELAAKLTNAAMDGAEKLRVFHDWIILNVIYDEKGHCEGQSAYGALIGGRTVCAGYSRGFMLLCQAVGIPCFAVSGVSHGENHMWNVVYLDDRWQWVDVTWDDPDDKLGTPETPLYDYFLVTSEVLKKDHQWNEKLFNDLMYIARNNPTYPLVASVYGEEAPAATTTEAPTTVPATDPAIEMPVETTASAAFDTASADLLNALGLFGGSDKGYELERAPYRIEAAAMLVRFLGYEADMRAYEEHYASKVPFADVPTWGKPYVGTLLDSGLTNGTSPTTFGSYDMATLQQFCTFLLRALDYEEGTDFTYRNAIDTAVSIGLLDRSYADSIGRNGFCRGDMVLLCVNALQQNFNDFDFTLLELLVLAGAVPYNAAVAQGFSVDPDILELMTQSGIPVSVQALEMQPTLDAAA